MGGDAILPAIGATQPSRYPGRGAVAQAVQIYKSSLQDRLVLEEARPTPCKGLADAYRVQMRRLEQFTASLDGAILDRLREIVNAVAVLELRAAGKLV